ISVLLHKLPPEHLKMIRFWLAFWREHRDVLLDGKLMPLHPETFYPLVLATTLRKRVVVMYQDTVVNPGTQLPDTVLIVNGTLEKRIVLECAEDAGTRKMTIRNCQGKVVQEGTRAITKGLHSIVVPAAGVLELERAASSI